MKNSFWFCAAAFAQSKHPIHEKARDGLRQMEKELHAPLLRRLSRGVALTEQGELLHRYAERIVKLACETAKLRRLDEETLGQLLSHIEGWKKYKAAKEGLLADLAPLFALLSGGNAIEGLNAYVN